MKTVVGLRLQRVEERLKARARARQRIRTGHAATPIRAVGYSPLREVEEHEVRSAHWHQAA